jgi:hypothetical protein
MESDELDSIVVPTSEIISEVDDMERIGKRIDPANEDDGDIEHPATQPDEATLKLIGEAIGFGGQFKSVYKQINAWRPTIIALKEKFKVTKGYEGIRIFVEGHAMFWNEFCEIYFGVGSRRINQLINEVDKLDNRTFITKPDCEKPLSRRDTSGRWKS